MRGHDWMQLLLFIGALLLITKPLGLYLQQVITPDGKTFLDRILKPLERGTYRLCGINPLREQSWWEYTVSLLAFSLVGLAFTFACLRWQSHLPMNLQGFPDLTTDLAFNTAVSFLTNTNWQSYGGESTMSYFSQMVALASHNFTSAAAGIAVAAALIRGLCRTSAHTLGNFWTDLVRVTYYVLLPLSVVFALFLVAQGIPQNFKPYDTAQLVQTQTVTDANNKPQELKEQSIVQGPIASQMAIKLLGTNGGGYVNANAAHPYENPTPLSNFFQMLAIFAIPTALTYTFGRMVKNQKHGWTVWAAMFVLFLAGTLVCWWAESGGNPIHQHLGVVVSDGNMEGKETRFGIFNSALFATVTTDASCGAVNAMHDSLTPLGGLVPLFNMQTGEVIFGGVGAGLYGMLIYVILAVFIAGLMVGRTPEYLGKKIESFDVKMCVMILTVLAICILGLTSWAAVSKWGLAGLNNQGPHGFSEILYAYSSCVGNNGSAFAGLTANTPWYNYTLSLAMLVGRFFMIALIMALAGNLAAKKILPSSAGTLQVHGITFGVLIIGSVLLIGALTFVPALVLGPVVEHFLMTAGKLF